MLFVPASRPDRFTKALASGADCVILDLEDAVSIDEKNAAREKLVTQLPRLSESELARTAVRINAVGTDWHGEDLMVVQDWCKRGLGGVMVPKSEAADSLDDVAALAGPSAQVIPLIESLAGLDAADQLVRARQVVRLAFGSIDFQLDLGIRCSDDESELNSVRFMLVAASRRANLPGPIDGVTVATNDDAPLRRDSLRARACGMGGKLCVHPNQVNVVNGAFAPSVSELKWAHRVLTAAELHGGAAFSLDGKMIDLPVIRSARKLLTNRG